MKKINGLVLSTLTAAFLVGCGGGGGSSSSSGTGSSGTTTPAQTSTDVTVERGAVYGARVMDAAGNEATQKPNSNVYTFATTPVYPITASGGIIDIDNNGIDEGDIELTTVLTSYSTVVTPITTYIGNPATDSGKAKLAKLKEIAGVSSDDDFFKKAPSELVDNIGTNVLVLTNALFDIMNDGDSSNDDFVSSYTGSAFETKFTTLKTEADKYTDKKEMAKALEEKVVTDLGLPKLPTADLANTTTSTTLKVADLKRFVSFDGSDWYDDNTVADGKITFKSYYTIGSAATPNGEWVLDKNSENDYVTITPDATNPYRFSYVDPITKEEGTFTILSTKKVANYSDLSKTNTQRVVTKMGTELDWNRWDTTANPTNWKTNTAITNLDELYANYSGVSNATVTKEADKVVLTTLDGKEHGYYRVVQENGNYYIEEADDLDAIGYTERETIFTGTSLDELIANIKAPAPKFTSWGNTYADENQTSAYTPTVTDSLKVTYSLSGLESSYFNIDSATGVVTFKVAPDYETKLAYSFYIIAKNSAGKISTQLVNIKINNLEEAAVTPTTPVATTSFVSGDTFNGLVYNIITSPVTGKQWLDRNLGASQACTNATDSACYGDYYQWGRLADGHEKSNSITTTTKASTISSVGNQFVTVIGDWTTEDSDGSLRSTSWSKTDGTGICPVGFRVPTSAEVTAEEITSSDTAFNNLKFPVAGARNLNTGNLDGSGVWADVWTSSSSTTAGKSYYMNFEGSEVNVDFEYRADGRSVRCIKGN